LEGELLLSRLRVPHLYLARLLDGGPHRVPLPEAIRLPSGEKTTLLTAKVCPLRVRIALPVCASHTFTSPGVIFRPFLSQNPPPEAMRLPSGLKHTLCTL